MQTFNGPNFEVRRYKGNQFGIFAVRANAFVQFGIKKQLLKKCQELNKKFPN